MSSKTHLFCLRPIAVIALGLTSLVGVISLSRPAQATEISPDPSTNAASGEMFKQHKHQESHEGGDHGKTPAGVHGVHMIDAGKIAFSYTPMFMRMEDNYIGSSAVTPQTIVTTIASPGKMANGMPQMYRIVPTSMDVESHMFNLMYGVTANLNLMVMASYQKKSMMMTTFSGATGTAILGTSSASTAGLGDTSVSSLWRIHKDRDHDVELTLGVSLPTGSNTQNITMLSNMVSPKNMPMYMTMRASYGMQLGTGTYDLLPGLAISSHANNWSWGAAWRSRLPLGNNSQGYRFGDQTELTGWGGYTLSPGVSVSARIIESIQGRIRGSDPMISGLMQGTNPNFYGGKHTDLLGGIEIAGAPFGYKNRHLAIEAGKTVLQDLNGPQLGRSWMANFVIVGEF